MEILSFGILFFLCLRTVVALMNAFGGLHLKPAESSETAKLSVLIPARNEERNLPILLESLLLSDYSDFEIWVCDDHSTDATIDILKKWSLKDQRINYFKGEDLPQAWTGKNFACHQLAKKANGDYFLYLDADVVVSKNALSKALHFVVQNKVGLLSIFPKQLMNNFSEQVSVPFMNWALLNLLPLALVMKSTNPMFSAANGQFMLFNSKEYIDNMWHEQVKKSNVEDILIARLMKESNKKVAVLLGDNDVFCRMYSNYSEALNGFSRNVHEFFLGRRWLMVLFWLVLVSEPFIVYSGLGWASLLLLLFLTMINCYAVSLGSRQRILLNMILHPFQMLFFTHLIVRNFRLKLKKQSEWKGRIISV